MLREDLPFADEVYRIIGAAIQVHERLGPGFLEAVYQEALSIEFDLASIPFQEQARLGIRYRDKFLKQEYKCDFLVFGQILVEIKALTVLGNLEFAQILNYLAATRKPVGLILNFGRTGKLEWKRMAGPSLLTT
ncbi:MAG: GxxExxY protein [Holophagaceae bacterium]|nr:GxxExxY protein [Holophagaceae bacterium]